MGRLYGHILYKRGACGIAYRDYLGYTKSNQYRKGCMNTRKKILIVDDEYINLEFFEVMLSKLGFLVEKAEDGEEGLKKVKNFLPDLILLDNIMPKMSGWELTKILKGDEKYREIPIIMISALDDVKDKVEGFELGVDDYVPKLREYGRLIGYIRNPFHTAIFTIGLKKTLNINESRSIYGEIIFEFNWTEMTQDFQFEWPYSFYFHHQLTHGYTNKGQWLGSGISVAGNSQYLAFKLYYPEGYSLLFISRNNPDNNYLYKNAIYESAASGELSKRNWGSFKANFLIGLQSGYYINKHFFVSAGLVYDLIINPFYEPSNTGQEISFMHNGSFQMGFRWSF
jgi:CheY-like chemotaxis protein